MESLASHLPRGAPPPKALQGLDVAALFLCCACARGDAVAIEELERSHLGKARAALRRIQGSATVAADVEQKLREMLFFPGKGGGAPKITRYGGRGDLGGWLRTVAMRTAFETLDPGRELQASDETLAAAPSGGADPELALIKAQYGTRLKEALEEALRSLPEESRRDVRRYYFEGLGVEALAERDGVAISTVSRRLAKARDLLLHATHQLLASRLPGGARELESMLRLAQTQLEITRGALAQDSSGGPPEPGPPAPGPSRRRKRP